MSERSLVIIYDYVPDTGKSEIWNAVEAAVSDMPEYCVLVFYYQTKSPDMRKSRSKILAEAAEKLGGICEFTKPEDADLKVWVKKHFAALGREAEEPAVSTLIEYCSGVMDNMFNDIQKLCAYKGTGKITGDDVKAVVVPSPEARTYELTELLAKGDYSGAYIIINELLYMRTEISYIASAIYKTYINLYMLKLARTKAEISAVQKQLGLRDFVADRYKRISDTIEIKILRKALDLCFSADIDMKSLRTEKRYILEKLIGDISALAA